MNNCLLVIQVVFLQSVLDMETLHAQVLVGLLLATWLLSARAQGKNNVSGSEKTLSQGWAGNEAISHRCGY